jgi:nicotinamidase-related amidase
MTDLGLDPAKTAVLAMDFQQGIISTIVTAQERNVVRKAQKVLNGARRAGVTVIHTGLHFREGHPEVNSCNRLFGGMKQLGLFLADSDEARLAKGLGPKKGDIVVSRPRVNAFYNTDLETILRSKGVDTLVLMGVTTNWVVEATARYAADADYRLILLEDCCAGMSAEAHEFSIANILGIIAEVVTSEEFLANLK